MKRRTKRIRTRKHSFQQRAKKTYGKKNRHTEWKNSETKTLSPEINHADFVIT